MDTPFLELDPSVVDRYVSIRSFREKAAFQLGGLGRPKLIHAGDWDRRGGAIEDHPVYRLMAGLYQQPDPERGLAVVEAYFRARGMGASAAREKRERKGEKVREQYVRLLARMAEEGYRPGAARDEVGVAIGRDGAVLKAPGGQHRFAAARVLGLPCVLAEVRYVHWNWYRDCRDPGLRECIIKRLFGGQRPCSLTGATNQLGISSATPSARR